jgi:hypothetical protein
MALSSGAFQLLTGIPLQDLAVFCAVFSWNSTEDDDDDEDGDDEDSLYVLEPRSSRMAISS